MFEGSSRARKGKIIYRRAEMMSSTQNHFESSAAFRSSQPEVHSCCFWVPP